MTPALKRELWLDLRGLMTPDEQGEWGELPSGLSACEWVREFVAARAWRSGLSVAERLQVHYRRLAHVREWYWIRRPRFQKGSLADQLGKRDSLEVDDRGLLYVRMGPPDRIARPPGESWAYYGAGESHIYHFSPGSKSIGGAAQPLADYRLHETLAAAVGFGLQSTRVRDLRGFLEAVAAVYPTRITLDAGYARVGYSARRNLLGSGPGELRPGVYLEIADQLAREEAENVADARFALQTIPDVPLLERTLRFASEVVRFRNPGEERGEVWVLGTARAEDVEVEGDGDEAIGEDEMPEPAYAFTARLSWVDDQSVRTAQLPVEASPGRELGDEDGLFFGLRLALTPGGYPYTLAVRTDPDEQGRAGGNWVRGTLKVPAATPELPALSDIAVASDSGGSWTRDGRTFLHFSPAHVTGGDGALHVYFEAYGIDAGGEYEVELRLVEEAEAGEMWSLNPGVVAFRLSFEAEMPRREHPTGRHHLRLDLADTEPGAYVLGVRVREEATGTQSLPVTTPVTVRE